MVSVPIVVAESESENKTTTDKNNGTKSTDAITSDKSIQSESRGPNEQEEVKGDASTQSKLDKNRDDVDPLFDFSTSSGTTEKKTNLTTDELRKNISRIMSKTHDERKRLSSPVTVKKKKFVTDLLSDASDEESVDLSVSNSSTASSILPDDYSQRTDIIDNLLASMTRPKPLNMHDLQSSGVLFYESPTGGTISVTHVPSVSREDASASMESKEFKEWVQLSNKKYGAKRISVMKLKILDVEKDEHDKLKCIKVKVVCKLRDEEARRSWKNMSEIFYLRRESLGLLFTFTCVEDNSQWSVLIDRPCVPIGKPSALELPTITFDEDSSTYMGAALKPMNDLCGIEIKENKLINLVEETYGDNSSVGSIGGMTPAPTESNEAVKFLHCSKYVTQKELQQIRKKLSEAREDGTDDVSLRVIPTSEIWKVSTDMKVMCALFLLEKRNNRPVSRSNSRGGPVNVNGPGLERKVSSVKEKMLSLFNDAKKSW